MIKNRRSFCVLLLLIAIHLIEATSHPTIDNIVNVLQSPAFNQIVLPPSLIMADPTIVSEPSATVIVSKPPNIDSSSDTKKLQKDAPMELDGNPTLKLVTRVLDTLRLPNPAPALLLVPQIRALPGCPLCDASVYSYCDYKVFHDGCCCGTTNGAQGGGIGSNGIGYGGCGFQEDCGFIYANSCYEHQLIVNCCCNAPY